MMPLWPRMPTVAKSYTSILASPPPPMAIRCTFNSLPNAARINSPATGSWPHATESSGPDCSSATGSFSRLVFSGLCGERFAATRWSASRPPTAASRSKSATRQPEMTVLGSPLRSMVEIGSALPVC